MSYFLSKKNLETNSDKSVCLTYSHLDTTSNIVAAKTVLLARKIENQMRKQNLSKQQFAALMDVQPSIITRWLSGTHNFTTTTLFEIEEKLQFRLVDLAPDMANRSPHLQLFLSVDSSANTVVNPLELINIATRVFNFKDPSMHLMSSADQSFKNWETIMHFDQSGENY